MIDYLLYVDLSKLAALQKGLWATCSRLFRLCRCFCHKAAIIGTGI